jgi:hypothetical protein
MASAKLQRCAENKRAPNLSALERDEILMAAQTIHPIAWGREAEGEELRVLMGTVP